MLYYHTSKGEFAARASLQSAEKQLAEYHFVRCNQCLSLIHIYGRRWASSMTYKIKYLPLAVQDLNDIARYLSGFYPKTDVYKRQGPCNGS